MNEAVFLCHLFVSLLFTLGALRLGKEALTTSAAVQVVAANLFVLKQTHLFGLEVTCSDVYVIGSMLSIHFLQEFFGKKIAMKGLAITFLAMTFFGLFAQIQLLYLPSLADTKHTAYAAILTAAPRIVLASFAAYLLSQLLSLRLFALAQTLPWPLALRSACVMLVCQLADTAMFAWVGLWGLVASLGSVILLSFIVKMVVIALTAPLTVLARKIHVAV